MNEKENKAFKDVLKKQQRNVKRSKAEARKLLTSLGMLTPSGDLKKSFKTTQ